MYQDFKMGCRSSCFLTSRSKTLDALPLRELAQEGSLPKDDVPEIKIAVRQNLRIEFLDKLMAKIKCLLKNLR
jgi:hypothetical protein